MKGLDDDSVDLIFCDLPYGATSCKWDSKIDLDKFWIEIMRIKKINTPIFFTTTTKFGVDLIESAPKKCPFRYDIVWVKSAPVGFLSAKKMPLRKHEMIYVFYEKLPFYDLSSHTHRFLKKGKKTEGDKGNDCYGKFSYYNNGEKGYDPPLPTTMLEIKSTKRKHSTEKPVALIEWILKYYSKEGDVVLDPTMGSGSTGVACKNMKRNFIGIEKDEEIYEIAVNRIED
jgi:site-specific DNA-methyltransferase (adenine-specific)